MNNNFDILDCTIRDGGYYTNWDFDQSIVESYLQHINELPIKYVEIGYRGRVQDSYRGEYFFLPISTIRRIRRHTSKDIAIMLDTKDFDANYDFAKLLSETCQYVSLVRLTVDPLDIRKGVIIADKLKDIGFEVALNVMYISSIDDDHAFFGSLSNIETSVDYIYLVDSYGSIFPKDLERLILKVKRYTNVALGFHGHNNIEMSFSNALKALECGVKLIDSTVLGMGRGAGNLRTELILPYLKSHANMEVNLNALGGLVEIFQPLYNQYQWGSNLAYAVSGLYSMPQGRVMNMLEIDRYSLTGVVGRLRKNTDVLFSQFKSKIKYKKCLVVGGGESVPTHIDAIKAYLLLNPHVVVIHSSSRHINLFMDMPNKKILAVAGDEVLKVGASLKYIDACVVSPSPREINIEVNSSDAIFELQDTKFPDAYKDSPLSISLDIALELSVSDVRILGFDGYDKPENKKQLYLMQENQAILDIFTTIGEITSLTSTKYKNIKYSSIYGEIE